MPQEAFEGGTADGRGSAEARLSRDVSVIRQSEILVRISRTEVDVVFLTPFTEDMHHGLGTHENHRDRGPN